jgi:hypothetical protein
VAVVRGGRITLFDWQIRIWSSKGEKLTRKHLPPLSKWCSSHVL